MSRLEDRYDQLKEDVKTKLEYQKGKKKMTLKQEQRQLFAKLSKNYDSSEEEEEEYFRRVKE